MGELRSAFETAMERAKGLGEASQEELKKRHLVSQGESVAAWMSKF